MVAVIRNVDANKFSLNGIVYAKNFVPFKVSSSQIKVISCYDSRFVLVSRAGLDEIEIDGVVYDNWKSLSAALVPVIFGDSTVVVDPTEPDPEITVSLVLPGTEFTEGDTVTFGAVVSDGPSVTLISPSDGESFEEGSVVSMQASV